MAISTYNSHIDVAKYYAGLQSSTFFVIGRTTAWSNEEAPPTPDPKTKNIEEVIGYKQASVVSLCRPIREEEEPAYETVEYGDRTWVLIPEDKAFEEEAKWLYYYTEIKGDELPTGFYRQVGVYVNLEANTEISKPNLLPGEVKEKGTLVLFDNRQPMNRVEKGTSIERFIVEC